MTAARVAAVAVALAAFTGCTVDSKDYHIERINGRDCAVYSGSGGSTPAVVCPSGGAP